MEEIWKDVNGYEGYYQVSSLGRVKSVIRKIKDKGGYRTMKSKLLKPYLHINGYFSVGLSNSCQKRFSVHRLVAIAFIPNQKETVNHINGIKTDNRVQNLEWATQKENNTHSYKTGLNCHKGEKNGAAKLTRDHVFHIKYCYHGMLHRQIAFIYGVNTNCVTNIINNKRWPHV